jgi:hypothetical protein
LVQREPVVQEDKDEHGARRKKQAELAVVIPSVNGWSDLRGCLEALSHQEGDPALEVIVVDRVGDQVRAAVAREFPEVTVLDVPEGTTIPAMRATAFTSSSAPVVGVIEDHVIVPPVWAGQMLAAHAAGEQVVGGSVDNAARDNIVEWASFLCEYSQCLAPETGSATWLTGNNITYRRELLDRHRAVIEEGGWENRLHDALRESGVELTSRPEITVGHKKHFTFAEYLSQRYLYARSYAGMRVAGEGAARRFAYGAAAFALPPLLLARVVGGVYGSGRYRAELARSLPLIAVFVCAWAVGEVVGYWFGAGDALTRVR